MQVLKTDEVTASRQTRFDSACDSKLWPPHDLGAVAQEAQGCGARTTIFYQGDPATALYEVVQGVVKMYKLTPDGRRQVIGFAFPGEILGSILGETHSYTAEAITVARLRRFPRERLLQALHERPRLSRSLLNVLASALSVAQEQMLLLGRKTATEKIASFLIGQSKKREERGENPALLFLPMTRSDIADYLGLTTETVSRTISSLRKTRVIDLDQASRIRIRDIDSLIDLAAGDEVPI